MAGNQDSDHGVNDPAEARSGVSDSAVVDTLNPAQLVVIQKLLQHFAGRAVDGQPVEGDVARPDLEAAGSGEEVEIVVQALIGALKKVGVVTGVDEENSGKKCVNIALLFQQRDLGRKEKDDKDRKLQVAMENYLWLLLGNSDVGLYRDGEDAVGSVPPLGSWDLSGARFKLHGNKIIVSGVRDDQYSRVGVRMKHVLAGKNIEVKESSVERLVGASLVDRLFLSFTLDMDEVDRVLRKINL